MEVVFVLGSESGIDDEEAIVVIAAVSGSKSAGKHGCAVVRTHLICIALESGREGKKQASHQRSLGLPTYESLGVPTHESLIRSLGVPTYESFIQTRVHLASHGRHSG